MSFNKFYESAVFHNIYGGWQQFYCGKHAYPSYKCETKPHYTIQYIFWSIKIQHLPILLCIVGLLYYFVQNSVSFNCVFQLRLSCIFSTT